MNILAIPVDRIRANERLRVVDAGYAALLADSIAEHGVRTPLEVREADAAGYHDLIAGAHRLEGAILAGLAEVPALVLALSDIDAELREVDENLMRRELSPLELGGFLARRKELHLRKHPGARRGGNRRGADQLAKFANWSRFTAEVAERTALSERLIRLAIHRWDALADVRARLAGTPYAANGSELDALARVPPGDRIAVVDILLADRCRVAEARARHDGAVAPQTSPEQRAMAALAGAWDRAPDGVKAEFRKTVLKWKAP